MAWSSSGGRATSLRRRRGPRQGHVISPGNLRTRGAYQRRGVSNISAALPMLANPYLRVTLRRDWKITGYRQGHATAGHGCQDCVGRCCRPRRFIGRALVPPSADRHAVALAQAMSCAVSPIARSRVHDAHRPAAPPPACPRDSRRGRRIHRRRVVIDAVVPKPSMAPCLKLPVASASVALGSWLQGLEGVDEPGRTVPLPGEGCEGGDEDRRA